MTLINQDQLSALRELAAGDRDFLASVIDAFLPQLEAVPAAIRSDLAAGEAQHVAERAHSLKGSASHVGAEAVGRLCRRIEEIARDGSLVGVAELLAELERVAAETRGLFEAEKAQLG